MKSLRVQVGLRLDAETLRKINLISKRNKRSVNNQIEVAVHEYIEKYEKDNGLISLSSEE